MDTEQLGITKFILIKQLKMGVLSEVTDIVIATTLICTTMYGIFIVFNKTYDELKKTER